jgi:hypothetical protein
MDNDPTRTHRPTAEWLWSSVRTFIREQPVAVVLAGLAAGIAVAAALPGTMPERPAFGPARARLRAAAETARGKITEATLAAGEQLQAMVKEGAVLGGLGESARRTATDIAGKQEDQVPGGPPGGTEVATDELESDAAKAAKAMLDAQQKAVDDIRAGRPAPYYFTPPQSTASSEATSTNERDPQKK